MGVLDDLIRIKAKTQEDDLLQMLDEITAYEKLSVNEQFKDLKKSEVTRKKCPMLAAFTDGKLYETVLADLAANIYLQIENRIPNVLLTTVQKTSKQERQMEILQSGIAHVEYHELIEYDHETMKDRLAAVFTKQESDIITAVLIVRNTDGYQMYHGSYSDSGQQTESGSGLNPVMVKGQYGTFSMKSYSVLGNNGYRFGSYQTIDHYYDIMIGPDHELYLLNDGRAEIVQELSWEEYNLLNLSKKDPNDFALEILHIIESVVHA